jgi:hypothetical protein
MHGDSNCSRDLVESTKRTDMNESPFKISGQQRREKKKELSLLKSHVKNFWQYEDIDRVYGGGSDDATCQQMIDCSLMKIEQLESELVEQSVSMRREDILGELGI